MYQPSLKHDALAADIYAFKSYLFRVDYIASVLICLNVKPTFSGPQKPHLFSDFIHALNLI